MYRFNKIQDNDGIWRFELDGINLLVEGYTIKDEKHWIKNPQTAIAYFNISGHLYGVSNSLKTFPTIEDLYDTLFQQYQFFKKKIA